MIKSLSSVLFILIFVASFSFMGCNDDDPTGPDPSNLIGTWVGTEVIDSLNVTFTYVNSANAAYTFEITGVQGSISIILYNESGTWEEVDNGDMLLTPTSAQAIDSSWQLVTVTPPERYFNSVDGNKMTYSGNIYLNYVGITEVDLQKQ
jgi:hypothetical protein